jgi:hypothetical protein
MGELESKLKEFNDLSYFDKEEIEKRKKDKKKPKQ